MKQDIVEQLRHMAKLVNEAVDEIDWQRIEIDRLRAIIRDRDGEIAYLKSED